MDSETKEPITNVDVYNNDNYQITNTDGKFIVKWLEDTKLSFKILGYTSKFIEKSKIQSDTIYLEKKFIELGEVVIIPSSILLKKAFNNINSQYPIEPFSEDFFLRSLARKNGEIVMLADVRGIVSRTKNLQITAAEKLPKNNFAVQILNARKAKESDDSGVKFFSFRYLLTELSRIHISEESFSFTELPVSNNFVKVVFYPKNENIMYNGYYIINTIDNVIQSFSLSQNEGFEYDLSGKKERKKGFFTKQSGFKLNLSFEKDDRDKKYYLDKATIGITTTESSPKEGIDIYKHDYFWYGENRTNNSFKNSINLNSEISSINKPYSRSFWKDQNKLLLTLEMKKFLEKLSLKNNNF